MSTAKGKPLRALIFVMMALVVITILIAQRYYKSKNTSVDPRIVPARELYETYNSLAVNSDYEAVIGLLDSIKNIYKQFPHYYGSFETGVLENNRAAVYITIGLTYDSINTSFHAMGLDSLMILGESAVRNSISIYEKWTGLYSGKTEAEIREEIKESFAEGLEGYSQKEINLFFENRVAEILASLEEAPRRLSVSYTNLGIIYRYKEDYQSAAAHYEKAIKLWEENLTAENNLNILLGRPLTKRTFIQKMFPKPKD